MSRSSTPLPRVHLSARELWEMYLVPGHRDRRNEFGKHRLSALPLHPSLLLNTIVYRPTLPMGYLMSPGIYTMDPVFIPHSCLSRAFLNKMT